MKTVEEIKSEILEKINELYQTIRTEKSKPSDDCAFFDVNSEEKELILAKVNLFMKEQEKKFQYDAKVKLLAQEGFSLEEIAVEMGANKDSDISHIYWLMK